MVRVQSLMLWFDVDSTRRFSRALFILFATDGLEPF